LMYAAWRSGLATGTSAGRGVGRWQAAAANPPDNTTDTIRVVFIMSFVADAIET